MDVYHYAGLSPVKMVDPEGKQNHPALDLFFMRYEIEIRPEDVKTGKNEKNMFEKIMTIVAIELTPMGLVSRVVMGKDPYDGKKLTWSERGKEAAKAAAFGATRGLLKAGHAVGNMGQLANPKIPEKLKGLKWGAISTSVYEKIRSVGEGIIKMFKKEDTK